MSIKTNEKRKLLKAQKDKLIVSIEMLSKDVKERQRVLSKFKNKLNEIELKLKKFDESEINVTEHAILRYIERIMGVDINKIRKIILNDDIKNKIEILGSGKYEILDKHFIIVKGKDIVSII